MFWGVVLKKGKRYGQTVAESFQLSMASIQTDEEQGQLTSEESLKAVPTISVYVEYDSTSYLICTLSPKDAVFQVPLALKFEVGSSLVFFTKGGSKRSSIHLTGFKLGSAANEGKSSRSSLTDVKTPLHMSTPNFNQEKINQSEISIGGKKTHQSILISDKKPKVQGLEKKRVSIKETPTQLVNDVSSKVNQLFNGGDMDIDDEDEDDEDYEDIDEDDSDEVIELDLDNDDEETQEIQPKRTPTPSASDDMEDSEEDEEDDDDDDDDEDDDEDEEEDEEDEEEDEDDLEAPELIATPTTKKSKPGIQTTTLPHKTKTLGGTPNQKKGQGNAATPTGNKTPENGQKGTPNQLKTPDQSHKINTPSSAGHTPMKFVSKGGVMIQELKLGDGQPVKAGKMVTVNYAGRLKQSNKLFDEGQGFKFRVGKGEVIKGWDIGLDGMKVGGKRKLVIPAHMAYGKRGAPPAIPPNSPLQFDIELKAVS